SPFAGSRDAAGRADDAASGDDDADVPPDRWDELLRERAVLAKPLPEGGALECGVELRRGPAEDDIAAPASEARLEHEGEVGRDRRHSFRDEPGVGMRQPGEAECARRQELVVCGDERARTVEHFDAGLGETPELDGTALHPVELAADVEPPQRDVSRLEDSERVAWGQHGCGDAEGLGGGGESQVRLAAPMGDDREPHWGDGAAATSGCGRRSGDARVSTWGRLRACNRRRTASG